MAVPKKSDTKLKADDGVGPARPKKIAAAVKGPTPEVK